MSDFFSYSYLLLLFPSSRYGRASAVRRSAGSGQGKDFGVGRTSDGEVCGVIAIGAGVTSGAGTG